MDSPWELVFMLLVLKIPMVYLGVVIWYAMRPEPAAEAGDDPAGVPAPVAPCGWGEWRDRRLARDRGRRPMRPSGYRGLPVAPRSRHAVAT
ncbi:MAG TPA: hypothetical protein VFK76_10520 [Gaiellaceae bacterium]|nr:hypothetical protein [Gaiellaceae bacterium]